MLARDRGGPRIGFQVLVYPAADLMKGSLGSRQESPALTKENMVWFVRNYLSRSSDAKNPYASPLRVGGLGELPPALMVTAEYDILIEQCERYAIRLKEAGVSVKTHHFSGSTVSSPFQVLSMPAGWLSMRLRRGSGRCWARSVPGA